MLVKKTPPLLLPLNCPARQHRRLASRPHPLPCAVSSVDQHTDFDLPVHQANNLEEAYDALCDLPERPLPEQARFRRAATQGMLRHAQWAAAQRAAAADVAGKSICYLCCHLPPQHLSSAAVEEAGELGKLDSGSGCADHAVEACSM